MSTTATLPQAQTTTVSKPDFGNGRYSALMGETWHDAQSVFGLTSNAAEKLARQIASDMGAIMANSPVKVKLGKISEDGKLTISEASKVKGITMTNALYSLKALAYAGEAGKNGFSFAGTKWSPCKQLTEYFLTLQ